MEKRVRVNNPQQVSGNRFLPPALRQQIVRLKRELDGCEIRLFEHLYVMNEIQEALTIAQKYAHYLTSDPLAVWERVKKWKEELEAAPRPSVGESKEAQRIHAAKGNVTKWTVPEMRQRIGELKGQLGEFAACVREAFDDMRELESRNRAVELADAVKCVDQLQGWDACKKREQDTEEEEEMGDL